MSTHMHVQEEHCCEHCRAPYFLNPIMSIEELLMLTYTDLLCTFCGWIVFHCPAGITFDLTIPS